MATEWFRVQLEPWNVVQTNQVCCSEQLCVYAWRPYWASFCLKRAPVQLFPVPGPQGEGGAECHHLAYDDLQGVYCLPSKFHLPSFRHLGGVRALRTDRQTDRQTDRHGRPYP